jgi:hypothetical protein
VAERTYEEFENGVLKRTVTFAVPDEVVAHEQIVADAKAALDTNRAFLALGASPTNAQVVAQVRALTNQNVRIIRKVLGLFDGTT